MIQGTFQFNGFLPLQSFFEKLKVHRDSNSQSGSSLGNVGVHSLALSHIPGNMKCDSWASFWPAPLQALALVVSLRVGLRQHCPTIRT